MDEIERLDQLIETLGRERTKSLAEVFHPKIKKARIDVTLARLRNYFEPEEHPSQASITLEGK